MIVYDSGNKAVVLAVFGFQTPSMLSVELSGTGHKGILLQYLQILMIIKYAYIIYAGGEVKPIIPDEK